MNASIKSRSIGVAITLMSCVLYTSSSFLIQVYSLDNLDVLFTRSLFQAVFATVAMVWKRSWQDLYGQAKSPSMWIFILITGILGNFAMGFFIESLKRIPLGDATILIHTDVIFTVFLSFLLLRTPITWWKAVFITILILGEVLVVKPEGYNQDPQYYPGVLCGLLASFSFGTLAVFIAGPLKDVPIEIVLGIGALMGLGICFILSWAIRGNMLAIVSGCFLHDGGLNLWIGSLMAFLAFSCLTVAIRFISPSLVLVLGSSEIVLAFVVQSLMLKAIPDFGQIFGVLATLFSTVMVLLEQEVMDQLE